jgi:hypothetical protein
VLEPGKTKTEDQGAAEAGEAGGDGNEAAAAEKGEIFGQPDRRIAVVERARGEAGEDARRHAELGQLACLEIRNGQFLAGLVGKGGRDFGRDSEQGLRPFDCHQVGDRAGEPGGAVILAGDADADAYREDEAELGEDRAAGRGNEGNVEQVGLTEAQQQAGHRQDGDRQHQRATERLQAVEGEAHQAAPFISGERASVARIRTASAVSASRAAAASALHASSRRPRTLALSAGMATAVADNSVAPRPINMAEASGSEATPPQIPNHLPCLAAPSPTAAISRSTAG